MRKMKNSKGFTLMEMLIVVTIIAILVAIMIPVMTTQLERARETADLANIRSAYAEASVDALTNADDATSTVKFTQTKAGWQYVKDIPEYLTKANGWDNVVVAATKGTEIDVNVAADGTLSFTAHQ